MPNQPTHRGRRWDPSAPRGFTLLEVILAMMISGMILVVALSLFSAIRRFDRSHVTATREAAEIASLQRTVAKAFQSLIMAPATNTPSALIPGGTAPTPGGAANPLPTLPSAPSGPPRLSITVDSRYPAAMVDPRPDAQELMAPQVVEVSLASMPIFAEPDNWEAWQQFHDDKERALRYRASTSLVERRRESAAMRRERAARDAAELGGPPAPDEPSVAAAGDEISAAMEARDRLRLEMERERSAAEGAGRDADADDEEDLNASGVPTEEDLEQVAIAAGVRGVFELIPDVPSPTDRPREVDENGNPVVDPLTEQITWSLWWRPMTGLNEIDNPAGTLEMSEMASAVTFDSSLARDPVAASMPPGSVRLISRLISCRWEALRMTPDNSMEPVPQIEATAWEEMPAYITLEIRTAGGRWQKWMFELMATRGPEPGSDVSPAALAAAGGILPPLGANPVPGAAAVTTNPRANRRPTPPNRTPTQPGGGARP